MFFFFLMEAHCVLCDVQTESLYIMLINASLQRVGTSITFECVSTTDDC